LSAPTVADPQLLISTVPAMAVVGALNADATAQAVSSLVEIGDRLICTPLQERLGRPPNAFIGDRRIYLGN
jgi:hypothetical protein